MHPKNPRGKHQLSAIQKHELVIAETYKLQGGKLILSAIYAKKPFVVYFMTNVFNQTWNKIIALVGTAPISLLLLKTLVIWLVQSLSSLFFSAGWLSKHSLKWSSVLCPRPLSVSFLSRASGKDLTVKLARLLCPFLPRLLLWVTSLLQLWGRAVPCTLK